MGSTEKLEMVFRQIEEESERRAKEEEAEGTSQPAPAEASLASGSNTVQIKKRRRGSISISRIGTFQDLTSAQQAENAIGSLSPPTSPVPWTPIPRNSALYQVDAGSASSLTSIESDGLPHPEEMHTTQKETIVGRRNTLTKAMGGILTKTLTHVRSRNTLRSSHGHDDAVVIGVSVEEATVEHEDEPSVDEDGFALPRVEQVSGRVLRGPDPPLNSPSTIRRSRSLVAIAKSLAKKFRRKSSKLTLTDDTP